MTNRLEIYREEFPVTEKYIYFDHSGVAPYSMRVTNALQTFLLDASNGGAFHYPKWSQQIAAARLNCARLINAEAGEIAFVKSTSHGLSIVSQGLDWQRGDNMIVYEKEFPSNLFTWLDLERKGVEVRKIPSRNGRIVLSDIEQSCDARTRLLAVSSVQFSNGFRIDLKKVSELCRTREILFCVDAIQSLGVIPMDVQAFHIDFLSADGHKWLLGPEGVGMFFCRKELAERLHPPLIGWRSVVHEFNFDHPRLELKKDSLRFEEGSMNLLGIFGLAASVELLLEVGVPAIAERVLDLGEVIIREAEKRGLAVLTPKERNERGGNVTIAGGFDPEQVRDELRKQGIMVNARGGGLRISPHFYNTEAELQTLFRAIDAFILKNG
jgi:cysteine desulfurase/selenocysteine lyase